MISKRDSRAFPCSRQSQSDRGSQCRCQSWKAPNTRPVSQKVPVTIKSNPMKDRHTTRLTAAYLLFSILLAFVLTGCERPDPQVTIVASNVPAAAPPTPAVTPWSEGQEVIPTPILQAPTTTSLPTYVGIPTPDPPHAVNAVSDQPFAIHEVNPGETLGYIAQIYGSSIEELQDSNDLQGTDMLFVGQEIRIPTEVLLTSPGFKIIPDSELVYGPLAASFDVREFAAPYNGYLMTYEETVEGELLSGPEILSLVAKRFSVNPRLLMAVLEYRSQWITRPDAQDNGYPLGYLKYSGLYQQLSWAANELNWGFYGRGEGGIASFLLNDGTRLAFDLGINNGTAGVQNMLGAHDGAAYSGWQHDVGPDGLIATYIRLFGSPFAYTFDPLIPADLTQPPLQLPWPSGETWYFTGGPHGGWAAGAAWAALDFAPPEEELGYCDSDYWVTAMSDGLVTRSEFGAVVVDLDGDGYEGTGWAITYMHLDTRDRVAAGTLVQLGDRLGHPSCEGGYSNAKHVHVSRLYNGRWIAADGTIPFEMGGWVSQGLGREYDGQLVRGDVVKEACDGCKDSDISQILAE